MRLTYITPFYLDVKRKRKELIEEIDTLKKEAIDIQSSAKPDKELMKALKDLIENKLHISNKRLKQTERERV